MEKIATKKGCTTAQLCLAYVTAQGPDFIAIPGTKKEAYLLQNWDSLKVGLSPVEMAEIRKAIDDIPIEGTQY